MLTRTLLCSSLAWFIQFAAAQPVDPQRVVVSDARTLLIEAIEAPSGQSYGILGGETGAAFGKQFQTSAPINVDVTTLMRYQEEGCRRLNVRFSQEGLMLPEAKTPQGRTIDFGINYCRTGLPPRSLLPARQP